MISFQVVVGRNEVSPEPPVVQTERFISGGDRKQNIEQVLVRLFPCAFMTACKTSCSWEVSVLLSVCLFLQCLMSGSVAFDQNVNGEDF